MIPFLTKLFAGKSDTVLITELMNVMGIQPKNLKLYKMALSHRSMKDGVDENNERLEYLGDAVLSSVVAHYLYKRYPYKDEGFLTEMRSKMVNRQQLNDVALKMGLKKITFYNKHDNALRASQIFGNTLEALVGAVYLDKGYNTTQAWITKHIILPHFYIDDLELVDINLKNKLIGWASKNNKQLAFPLVEEKLEGGRRWFIMSVTLDGEQVSTGRGHNKKDASYKAAQAAIEALHI